MKRRVHKRICQRELPGGERKYRNIYGRWPLSLVRRMVRRPGSSRYRDRGIKAIAGVPYEAKEVIPLRNWVVTRISRPFTGRRFFYLVRSEELGVMAGEHIELLL